MEGSVTSQTGMRRNDQNAKSLISWLLIGVEQQSWYQMKERDLEHAYITLAATSGVKFGCCQNGELAYEFCTRHVKVMTYLQYIYGNSRHKTHQNGRIAVVKGTLGQRMWSRRYSIGLFTFWKKCPKHQNRRILQQKHWGKVGNVYYTSVKHHLDCRSTLLDAIETRYGRRPSPILNTLKFTSITYF